MSGLATHSVTSTPVLPARIRGYLVVDFKSTSSSSNGSINGIECFVDNRKIEPVPFSEALIEKIFPQGSLVLLPAEGGDDLPTGKITAYSDRIGRHSGDRMMYMNLARERCEAREQDSIKVRLYTERKRQNRNGHPAPVSPSVQLFEIHVTNGLYTYILLMPGPYYIRTELRRKADIRDHS